MKIFKRAKKMQKMVKKNGQKWSKMTKNGQKWPKMTKYSLTNVEMSLIKSHLIFWKLNLLNN